MDREVQRGLECGLPPPAGWAQLSSFLVCNPSLPGRLQRLKEVYTVDMLYTTLSDRSRKHAKRFKYGKRKKRKFPRKPLKTTFLLKKMYIDP